MLGSLILANEEAGQAAAHAMSFGWHEASLLWSSAAVIGVVVGTAIVARGQAGLVPKGVAAVYEHIFDWLEGLAFGLMGKQGRRFVPLACSFFLYILMCSWIGLLPWPSFHEGHAEVAAFDNPASSISTTLALAMLAVLSFNMIGLRHALAPYPDPDHGHDHEHAGHGHEHHHAPSGVAGFGHWVARFIDPVPMIYRDLGGALKVLAIPMFFLFLLINILERFIPLVSLSLRLFGNMSAKHTVKVSLLTILEQLLHDGGFFNWGLAVIIFGSTCFVALLGALAGFLQAMIFTVLFLSYIAHAVHTDH
ncbi:F0F1 ATP synthase subunit A [bacterium]|nr:F0F1 ATP synthase subunit A [bacterium]